jgi:hypothetical protein
VKNHAIKHGKPAPVPITKNFIDFLVLYGTFGGDVHPSDDDDDSDTFEELDNSTDEEARGPPIGRSERSPLLSRRSSSVLRTTQGTSPRKVFFMIMKVRCGQYSFDSRLSLGLVFYFFQKRSLRVEWHFLLY